MHRSRRPGEWGADLVRILHKGPAVHITDVRLAPLIPQQVESADLLAKGKAHHPGNFLLL